VRERVELLGSGLREWQPAFTALCSHSRHRIVPKPLWERKARRPWIVERERRFGVYGRCRALLTETPERQAAARPCGGTHHREESAWRSGKLSLIFRPDLGT